MNEREIKLADQPMFPGLGYRRNAAGDITVEAEIHSGGTVRAWLSGQAMKGMLTGSSRMTTAPKMPAFAQNRERGGHCVQRFVSTPLQVVDIETNKNQSFFTSARDINAYVV